MARFDGGYAWLAAIAGAVLVADYAEHGSVWRSALFIVVAWLVCKVSGYCSRALTLAHLEEANIAPIGSASPRQLEFGRFLRRNGATIALVVILAAALLSGFFMPDDGCWIDWDGRSNPLVCD